LRENDLVSLTPGAFLNFEYINHTSLAGNPIRSVQSGAFVDTHITFLDLSNCLIHSLSPEAFRGLEKGLEALDLSANRLKSLPDDLFDDFDHIKRLELNDNMLALSPNASFNGFR
jgi:Leucine-rich repeat (LRR) protein